MVGEQPPDPHHDKIQDEEYKLDFAWAMFFAELIEHELRIQSYYKQRILPTYRFRPGTKEGPRRTGETA